ncbi:11977_t:CDS:2 [Rhizophagus irregularis]|nr:11977_t:CDS:2 [Rhizophagus irregularis]
MAQPSTLNMSSANFGIPTPPANDTSDSKNPFFPNSDSGIKENEKNLNIINNSKNSKIIPTSVSSIHDITSETSNPSTPEPYIQSQSKCRFYITDPSIVPLLVARIAADSNNIKLPNSLSSFHSNNNNYGDLSISSTPSVCDSVSSVPDLSDSASSPISPPDDESSDSTASSSSTDQSCSISCLTSSKSTSSASSSSIAITSYSNRVLQKISSTSSKSIKSKSDRSITNDEKKNETGLGNSSIVNAIVAASAAPRTVPIPNRSDRRSKRKGIPYKSPSHEDLLREPGFVFRFPIVFDNALPSNHIVRRLTQARKNKMRTRPVTRAKNKKENQELDMFKLGYDQMIDSQINNSTAIEEAKARKRRVASVGRPSKKLILPSSGSQVPRSSNSGENNKSPRELSDFDLNSDNFGDDEDDPDFAPPAKKRRSEVQRGSKTVGRKESNSKVKVCASCRTKSTPCWRPGWSTDLMLCNSCGLRYKKTKCVCVNPECRYIPLKSEYNAMFKKPKNGDSPDPKRCCKCQTPL